MFIHTQYEFVMQYSHKPNTASLTVSPSVVVVVVVNNGAR